MTQCQDEFRNLSGCVLKILTAGRILQISIAWCQIEAEIHSFPTMYGKGGVDVVKIGEIKVSVQKLCLKQGFFWGHKSGSSHFRVASDPLFQRWCQFRYVPQKVWVKSFQMSYGHVRYLRNCPNAGLLHYFSERTRKMGKNGTFSHFCKLLQCKNFQEVSQGAKWKLTSWRFRKCGSFCCYKFLNRSYGCSKSTESEILAMLAKIRVVKKN